MKELLQRALDALVIAVKAQGIVASGSTGDRREKFHAEITASRSTITDLRAAIAAESGMSILREHGEQMLRECAPGKAEGEPVDTGKLWSLFRSALDKGHDMWATADDQGMHYEMASALKDAKASEYADKAAALYTAPPKAAPMSEEEILRLVDKHIGGPTPDYPLDSSDWINFARAIEARKARP